MEETKEELDMYRGLYYSCKDKLMEERQLLKELLNISYRVKWSKEEKAVWLRAENLAKTFKQ